MPFVDPVHSARGRLAYSSRTDIVQHDPNAVSNARRELTAAKLERSVRGALAAATPLTAEAASRNTCSTRTALGDSLVQPGVGFARNLRRLQDLLEPDAVKVARPVLRGPRRSNALGATRPTALLAWWALNLDPLSKCSPVGEDDCPPDPGQPPPRRWCAPRDDGLASVCRPPDSGLPLVSQQASASLAFDDRGAVTR